MFNLSFLHKIIQDITLIGFHLKVLNRYFWATESLNT